MSLYLTLSVNVWLSAQTWSRASVWYICFFSMWPSLAIFYSVVFPQFLQFLHTVTFFPLLLFFAPSLVVSPSLAIFTKICLFLPRCWRGQRTQEVVSWSHQGTFWFELLAFPEKKAYVWGKERAIKILFERGIEVKSIKGSARKIRMRRKVRLDIFVNLQLY
jgi:hypothetical protein